MSSSHGDAMLVSPSHDAGLWRVRWFRVLTIANSGAVLASACVWVWQFLDLRATALSWAWIAFPVIPATVAMPVVSALIVAVAAGLSCLNMIGERHKTARFVRAMTVYGTIVLGLPVVFTVLCAVIAAIGAFVTAVAGAW